MIVIPAIDIKGGIPVRLYKGDYSTAGKVADNAVSAALNFKSNGAEFLHMVDLDAAKSGKTENTEIILETAKKTGLKIDVGGGIRNLDTVEMYLSHGIYRVVLGTAAVENPQLVKYAVGDYGARIAVGIDAKINDTDDSGKIAVSGWTGKSELNYEHLAVSMAKLGVKYFVFTDIERDGTLEGVNVAATRRLSNKVAVYGAKVIASGGVKDITDIRTLRDRHIYAVICGKALYSGTLDLNKAITEAKKVSVKNNASEE